jgi:4-hydroxy-tetrahydrodipicolinate synthase
VNTMSDLGRLITAMITPFDDKGEIDYEEAGHLATSVINSGSAGVIVSGTTGESPALSKEEKIKLLSAVKEAVGNKGSVIAGTSNNNTQESIEISQAAQQAGADGLLLTVPYYNKPPQQGLYEHFKLIAESVDVPCMLYNVPSRTSTNMTDETTVRLSHIENIVGVKEASSDLAQICRVI